MLLYTWIAELKLNQINQMQASAQALYKEAEIKTAQEEIA
jgi:hypothetical protein